MSNASAAQRALTDSQIEDAGISAMAGFFYAWLALHRRVECALAANAPDGSNATAADDIIEAQSTVMSIAEHIPAKSYEDFAFKLALWRWDAPARIDEMDRAERIVHAVFLDLIELTGMESLFTSEDLKDRSIVVRSAA